MNWEAVYPATGVADFESVIVKPIRDFASQTMDEPSVLEGMLTLGLQPTSLPRTERFKPPPHRIARPMILSEFRTTSICGPSFRTALPGFGRRAAARQETLVDSLHRQCFSEWGLKGATLR
jgi:hypothetical protein